MPSPFPGMDPYLEAPDIWPDFHHSLAGEIRTLLNGLLPPPYYAQTEMRPEIGIVDPYDSEDRTRRVVPDVAIVRQPHGQSSFAGGTALLDARTDVSEFLEVQAPDEPVRHHYVEIRDSKRAHKLITLIEIVSPSNKRPGKDRDSYLAKQREVLASDASLVEIDLLREGARLVASEDAAAILARQPVPVDYLIVVTRSWGREQCRLYLASIRQVLPVVAIPLRKDEAEVPLDVQFAVNRAYDGGPYRRGAVDYGAPPAPPLRAEDAAWADTLLAPLRQPANT